MADKIVGMYVHQHWPYNHPYAARTWTLEDWRGYADGLQRLGFNTILIWPLIEMMVEPLHRSDQAYLRRMGQVIGMLKGEFGMRVMIALCPNVWAIGEVAHRAPIEDRHFFYCDVRVNPADRAAVKAMIRCRERIFAVLREVDAVTIIDSDPGGYPGSTNADFVNLFVEHRKMFDRVRRGIELIYWVHAGWQGYSRFYATGHFEFGREEEFLDTMRRLAEANLEPWGLANGLEFAQRLGLQDRVIGFNYGAIEGEPAFPFTNYTIESAHAIGARPMPRGVLGNAQTHCVQIPNTFAFVRGALGQPVSDQDCVALAEDLILGHGALIQRAWQALAGPRGKVTDALPDAAMSTSPSLSAAGSDEAEAADACAAELDALAGESLMTGPLRGLLFGSPARFIDDLVLQLRVKSTSVRLVGALNGGGDWRGPLRDFVAAVDLWQAKHGYKNRWHWPDLFEALKKMGFPEVDRAVLTGLDFLEDTGFDRVKIHYYREETHTLIILQALKRALIGAPRLGDRGGQR